MPKRITQAKLQRYAVALQSLVSALYDAKKRYTSGQKISMRQFGGMSTFIKDLKALPSTSDYSRFEVQLKRRLVRLHHRLEGHARPAEVFHEVVGQGQKGIREQLPAVYQEVLDTYVETSRQLLRSLADVDIETNHQPLISVTQIIAKS